MSPRFGNARPFCARTSASPEIEIPASTVTVWAAVSELEHARVAVELEHAPAGAGDVRERMPRADDLDPFPRLRRALERRDDVLLARGVFDLGGPARRGPSPVLPDRLVHHPRRSTSHVSVTRSPVTRCMRSWYATVGSTCAGRDADAVADLSPAMRREREVLVGAEPHLGAFDGGIPVVHAERFQPAVRDRVALPDTMMTVASDEQRLAERRLEVAVRGVHRARTNRPVSRSPRY